MKKTIILLSVLFGVLVFSSCTHHHYYYKTKRIPPGHAKKITGSKSAKPYAPGQRKKRMRGH